MSLQLMDLLYCQLTNVHSFIGISINPFHQLTYNSTFHSVWVAHGPSLAYTSISQLFPSSATKTSLHSQFWIFSVNRLSSFWNSLGALIVFLNVPMSSVFKASSSRLSCVAPYSPRQPVVIHPTGVASIFLFDWSFH